MDEIVKILFRPINKGRLKRMLIYFCFFAIFTSILTTWIKIKISSASSQPAVLGEVLQAASPLIRNRVKIVNNTVVADNGNPLRGETMHAVPDYGITEIRNDAIWKKFRDQYHLNTIGIGVFRNSTKKQWELQYFESIEMPVDKNDPNDPYCYNGPNQNCAGGVKGNGKYQEDIFDYLDAAVDQCEKFGMYCMI